MSICSWKPAGVTDVVLLERFGVRYSDVFLAGVAKELADGREEEDAAMAAGVHARFTCRM